ncbi:MAG TPA: hypothetical protein VMM12_00415, partial [Longimicrobiales bacterium]|nr:hypothetical protein [Longimicrobiales bacterium]
PNGGIQPIGGGHRLEFAPNAVSGLSNYYVRRGPTAGRAEIDIVPQGAADTEFGADVFLELSYAGCPDLANDTLVIVMTHPAQKSLGGRNDRQRRVVRALIPHLTMFAIAR